MIYDEIASNLQREVRASEAAKDQDYSEAEVRRATAYTREDMVLLVSHLSSVNKQLDAARRKLRGIANVLGVRWTPKFGPGAKL